MGKPRGRVASGLACRSRVSRSQGGAAPMRQVHEKLVRDGIPARLDAACVPYEIRAALPEEMRGLLLAKLGEEVAELLVATSDADALDEIADISEVLAAIASLCGAGEGEAAARQ